MDRQTETLARRPAPTLATWVALVGLIVLAIGACGGTTTTSPTASVDGGAATSAPTAQSSGAAACIDPATAAVIQSLRVPGADVQAIITEQGDTLIAGLESFTPPPDATAWRDELITAIESGDAEAVQAQVAMIGAEVTLEFC